MRKTPRKPVKTLYGVGAGGAARMYGAYGASQGRKSLATWLSSGLGADDDIVQNLPTLRSRSRDLFMGSPLATGVIKTVRTNVVGSGLTLNAHIDRRALGLSEEEAAAWEENVEREFALWSSTTACDASRSLNFYQLQALVCSNALLSGDCFVMLPSLAVPGSPYLTKIYVIESDRVCNPMDAAVGMDVLEGVEVGRYGEPVAYWIAKYHPYSYHYDVSKTGPQHWTRVPAFGPQTGLPMVLHVRSDFERPGQRRGLPFLAPVIEALKQIERYTDAELQAAVISGLFTGFITTSDGSGLQGGFPGLDDETKEDDVHLGNGSMVRLATGEDVKFSTPGRPNANFNGFVESIAKQIGAALELPYELVVKKFDSSYSASRAALLEAWKMFRMRRQWLADAFCQPVYEKWLSEAVLTGRVEVKDLWAFEHDPAVRRAYGACEWSGDAQGQLDPLKEANAAVVRIQNGLSTRQYEAAALNGMSVEQIDPQLKKEAASLADALGTAPASNPPPDNEDDEDNKDE